MSVETMSKDLSKKNGMLIEKINEIDILKAQLMAAAGNQEDFSNLLTPRTPGGSILA